MKEKEDKHISFNNNYYNGVIESENILKLLLLLQLVPVEIIVLIIDNNYLTNSIQAEHIHLIPLYDFFLSNPKQSLWYHFRQLSHAIIGLVLSLSILQMQQAFSTAERRTQLPNGILRFLSVGKQDVFAFQAAKQVLPHF